MDSSWLTERVPSPDYDDESCNSTPRSSMNPSPSTGFLAYNRSTATTPPNDYLLPSLSRSSRGTSGRPLLHSESSSSASDSDSEPGSPLLRTSRLSTNSWRQASRRRRKNEARTWRFVRTCCRQLFRFCPRQPLTIILSLILFSVFAIFLTLLLMYILNPDKDPLPWRAYCSVPAASIPQDYVLSPPSSTIIYPEDSPGIRHPYFPPPYLESLPPAGIFVAVFSMDSSFERRMLIRTTYATHPRSRDGAGDGDGGRGTSRTILRFVLGQPRKDWERRVQLEMEMYNDMIILPVTENMNNGKSHVFFTWASKSAWVPPIYDTSSLNPTYSYSNDTAPPPPIAQHDPSIARQDATSKSPKQWTRPDFVVKLDDDAFLMLAELEARLRLELHLKQNGKPDGLKETMDQDPLIYWGYLVTNRLHRFMAGELYALSWSLITWVANDPVVKTMVTGKEDKQTSKWMRLHPNAKDVRWTSERCWIYDHPRAGSVYAHGFLFPSERTRAKETIMDYPERTPQDGFPSRLLPISGNGVVTPSAWADSSVSTFHKRYAPPIPDLEVRHSVEALVEGSEMSKLKEDQSTAEYAWTLREGRRRRYENQRVGGTVVVHFIKKHMWFIETAMAFLEGDEFTDKEKLSWQEVERIRAPSNSTFAVPSDAHRTMLKRRLGL